MLLSVTSTSIIAHSNFLDRVSSQFVFVDESFFWQRQTLSGHLNTSFWVQKSNDVCNFLDYVHVSQKHAVVGWHSVGGL
jgi:hypothetical protein